MAQAKFKAKAEKFETIGIRLTQKGNQRLS